MSPTRYSKLSDEEGEYQSEKSSTSRTTSCRGLFVRYSFRIAIELAIIGLLVLLIDHIRQSNHPPRREPIGYSVLPTGLRQPPTTIKTFEGDSDFAGYSNSSKHAWNSLMPRGRGFIPVENPTVLGMKGGITVTDTVDRFPISAFHQLHCLAIVREAYYELRFPVDHPSQGGHHPIRSPEKHNHQELVHLDHCFDYLRQAIMCTADPAVEHAHVEADGSRVTVDGWGTQHQCRSWEALFTFALNNRIYDEDGVLDIGDNPT